MDLKTNKRKGNKAARAARDRQNAVTLRREPERPQEPLPVVPKVER